MEFRFLAKSYEVGLCLIPSSLAVRFGLRKECIEVIRWPVRIKGLQVVDISNPFDLKVTASFQPPVPQGSKEVLSNDVCWDDRGLIYLVDRDRGLHILERI